jgi:hypothetical protein
MCDEWCENMDQGKLNGVVLLLLYYAVMEGHAENSSDKNDLNAESQTFLNFKKSLFVTTRGSIKWVGNLASLK